MDKEVKNLIEELQETHKCVILLSLKDNITMTVFFDNGKVCGDINVGRIEDNKYKIMVNMRRFFKQGC